LSGGTPIPDSIASSRATGFRAPRPQPIPRGTTQGTADMQFVE
jgi:hypothetical protein